MECPSSEGESKVKDFVPPSTEDLKCISLLSKSLLILGLALWIIGIVVVSYYCFEKEIREILNMENDEDSFITTILHKYRNGEVKFFKGEDEMIENGGIISNGVEDTFKETQTAKEVLVDKVVFEASPSVPSTKSETLFRKKQYLSKIRNGDYSQGKPRGAVVRQVLMTSQLKSEPDSMPPVEESLNQGGFIGDKDNGDLDANSDHDEGRKTFENGQGEKGSSEFSTTASSSVTVDTPIETAEIESSNYSLERRKKENDDISITVDESEVWYNPGEIRSVSLNDHCIDAGSADGSSLILFKCHGLGGNQDWQYTQNNELKKQGQCADYFGGPFVLIFPCHGSEGNQKWVYNPKAQTLHHPNLNKCLTWAGESNLAMKSCDGDEATQKWIWKDVHST